MIDPDNKFVQEAVMILLLCGIMAAIVGTAIIGSWRNVSGD